MKGSDYGSSALGIYATLAVLSGCGGWQPPTGALAARFTRCASNARGRR